MRFMRIIPIFLVASAAIVATDADDWTRAVMGQAGTPSGSPASDDDFSPMLFFMLLVFLAVCLVLLGIGIVVGVCGIALVAFLTAVGVISSSVAVGLFRKRFSAGWRAFLVLSCVAAFIPCGIAVSWLVNHFAQLSSQTRWIIGVGAASGLIIGV